MKDQNYIVIDKKGEEVLVAARTAAEALGVFLKRGRFGLGAGWILTRQPDGWIVASNKTGKTLERTYHKLREADYSRAHKRYSNVG